MSTETPPGSRTPRVLIVEDDEDIAQLLAHSVRKAGFEAAVMLSGTGVLGRVRDSPPDLLLLDVMLPGLDGRDICRALRADPGIQGVPVIMLTARAEEAERVAGLELGADDYVTKPFSPQGARRTRRARASAHGRRRRRHPRSVRTGARSISSGTSSRRRQRGRAHGEGVPAAQYFLEHRGRVLSRDLLFSDVWGYRYTGGTRTVDVHVRRLREKLPVLAEAHRTVQQFGYKLGDPP